MIDSWLDMKPELESASVGVPVPMIKEEESSVWP